MENISAKHKALLIFRIIAAMIGIFGLTYRLVIDPLYVDGPYHHLFQLGFFSVQSFIYITLIFVALVINQLRRKENAWPTPAFRGAALLYGIISATLFGAFFIGSFNAHGLSLVVLYSNHLLLPILIMVDNVISIPPRTYKFDLLIFWMLYPLYYLVYTIFEMFILKVNRYYFLAFDENGTPFYAYLLFLMAAMFLICGALIIFINKIFRMPPEIPENINDPKF